MYGDPEVVRALARRVREHGDDIRAEADDVLARVGAVAWTGLAADAMRGLAREHAHGLRSCAQAHHDAADALDRHARQVEHLQEMIAAIERRVRGLLDGAAHGLAGLIGHVVPGGLDDWARHFDPPPTGSREWLDVHIPGSA